MLRSEALPYLSAQTEEEARAALKRLLRSLTGDQLTDVRTILKTRLPKGVAYPTSTINSPLGGAFSR